MLRHDLTLLHLALGAKVVLFVVREKNINNSPNQKPCTIEDRTEDSG